ncbi:hypothetical protein CN984_12505 [Bacillus cereus]|uniref:Uncharacterized protein n=1 Tax=Bacillus cereus TaxID=1396 RepID=A0A2A7FP24_BACCE|nr:hypothetical protein [Bacillus cereus]PEA25919.1 hypothetical protein CON44_18450 [Bacillus cereus]PGO29239.1 hypothetical protein CN984_12505 [Bacillus cereus]
MSEEVKESPYIYKLPLERMTDKDLLDWIDEMPRNKKAEIVRHALRFYKSHLGEGEYFYYAPPAPNSQQVYIPIDNKEVAPSVQEPIEKKKPKRPPAGIFSISKAKD